MRFPPSILDEIRGRLPLSQVVGRKVALKKAGREWRGLSPFKTEKTPSFFVNDHKAFYHCFASGEHGDIFTFLMKTEGLSFPEAVERLATEAGVSLPKPTERDVAREDERDRLAKVLEASAAYFEKELAAPRGREAAAYLERRGLATETQRTFRLGYAPNSRAALKEHLAGLGFSQQDMALSGMLIAGDDIPVSYDRFRHRVIFPIRDPRGRVIAFGGRALSSDVQAKYLNSPETPLFHKGNVLFNADLARQSAHDEGTVIVVEGYMDAVALYQAGIRNVVAPLGTALTEDHLRLLWRFAPEPVLCFDGDPAGQRAAYRAVDVALSFLKPGHSLQFAFLPDGMDPDDLVRTSGPTAMRDILAHKLRPLVDVLIEKEERASPSLATPEQLAAFEGRLKLAVARIQDETVRRHYQSAVSDFLWNRLRKSRMATTQRRAGGRPTAAYQGQRSGAIPRDWRQREMLRQGFLPQARQHAKVAPSPELQRKTLPVPPREAAILLALIEHPWLISEEAEAIATLDFSAPAFADLRDALLTLQALDKPLETREIHNHLEASGLDKVVALAEQAITHKCDKFLQPSAERAEVITGWHDAVALHRRLAGY